MCKPVNANITTTVLCFFWTFPTTPLCHQIPDSRKGNRRVCQSNAPYSKPLTIRRTHELGAIEPCERSGFAWPETRMPPRNHGDKLNHEAESSGWHAEPLRQGYAFEYVIVTWLCTPDNTFGTLIANPRFQTILCNLRQRWIWSLELTSNVFLKTENAIYYKVMTTSDNVSSHRSFFYRHRKNRAFRHVKL